MQKYDCLIIGSGTAAGKIAKEFAKRDQQVAIVERDFENFGGACINFACIPTKVLIEDGLKGISYKDALERKNYIVEKFRASKYKSLHKEKNITLIKGEARFKSNDVVEVVTSDRTFPMTGKHIVLNTGASSIMPDIVGIEYVKHHYTSTTIMDREQLPNHLIIVGGGYIGLEFATLYKSFGSKVTIIHRAEVLLQQEDEEIRRAVEEELQKSEIEFLCSTEAVEIIEENGQVTVKSQYGQHLTGDAILFATGRKPNTDTLQIKNTSIKLNDHGAVQVDETLKTAVPHIWAVGDVKGEEQFTYIAHDDGKQVVDQIFGNQERLAKPRKHVQFTVFTDPPLSRVGLTEQMAQEKGYDVVTQKVPVRTIGRAYLIRDTRGLFKSVIDANSGKILGVTLFGPRSEELINSIKIAMDANWNYQDLRDHMFNHPVMSESFNALFTI